MINLKDIIELYTQSFTDDSPEVIALFFANILGVDNCYYLEENNKLTCQLFIVDKTLYYLNNDIKLPFIVGLGTDNDYRYKGLATVLMKKVLSNTDAPFIALYPFSHIFYQKMGFATVSYDHIYKHKTVPTTKDNVKAYFHKYNKNKDFYIVREDKDFDWLSCVMVVDGATYYQTLPDGYTNGEETVIIGADGKVPGTMVRIANLQLALEYSLITLPPIKITDSYIEKNNVITAVEKGKMISCENFDYEITIEELCLILFGKAENIPFYVPKLKGHLLDRY